MVNTLVRLDRLPTETSLEGLLLLRQAWDEHDIAKHLAGWYKVVAKLLFVVQLLLGFGVVGVAAMSDAILEQAGVSANASRVVGVDGMAPAEWTEMVATLVFGLSLGASFLISLDSFLNAKSKWRQLRSFAGTLTSIIWQYRCRIAPFDVDRSNPDGSQPETALREALIAWRNEMAAGADLHVSTLRKSYAAATFVHQQHAPKRARGLGAWLCYALGMRSRGVPLRLEDAFGVTDPEHAAQRRDDHHSPVHAEDYISMRLVPAMQWYKQRIPNKNCWRVVLKLTLLSTSVTASIFARFSLVHYTALVTALTSAFTAWSEFTDSARKIERYNRAIGAIANLLSWWESLSDVDKAAAGSINHLIQTGEAVISEERLAWQSTAAQERGGDEARASVDETEGARGNDTAEPRRTGRQRGRVAPT